MQSRLAKKKKKSFRFSMEGYFFLFFKLDSRRRGVYEHTGCNDVVDYDDLLARLDGIALHLEEVTAVLLLILLGDDRSRQLSLLPDGDKGSPESQGQGRAEEKPTSIETDDDIWFLVCTIGLEQMQLEAPDERLVEGRVCEDGQDILEQDTWRREIRELAQRRAQLHLKTGEFGGAGGRGGGVPGDLGGGRGIGLVAISLLVIGGGGKAHARRSEGRRWEQESRASQQTAGVDLKRDGYIYIYIYIYRQRERGSERESVCVGGCRVR